MSLFYKHEWAQFSAQTTTYSTFRTLICIVFFTILNITTMFLLIHEDNNVRAFANRMMYPVVPMNLLPIVSAIISLMNSIGSYNTANDLLKIYQRDSSAGVLDAPRPVIPQNVAPPKSDNETINTETTKTETNNSETSISYSGGESTC